MPDNHEQSFSYVVYSRKRGQDKKYILGTYTSRGRAEEVVRNNRRRDPGYEYTWEKQEVIHAGWPTLDAGKIVTGRIHSAKLKESDFLMPFSVSRGGIKYNK